MLPNQIATALDGQFASGCSSFLTPTQYIEGNDFLVRQAKDLIVAAAASVFCDKNMSTSPNGTVRFAPGNSLLARQHYGVSMGEPFVRVMPQGNSFSVRRRL